MSPKNERFEMRLEEDLLTRVDEWRLQQADLPSRAEAMRRLVELGLARTSSETVRFSDGEKLITIMLRDIYKHLGIDRGEIDADFIGQVIWGGHLWAPKWVMQGLFHEHEDDPREVRFVVNVLDMWNFIERSYETLSKQDQERVEKEADPFGKHVKFRGFDGNNESTHMSIAHFLVDEMGRFSRFKGRDLNSHMPTLATYGRMLEVFEPLRAELIGRDLDADEIIAVLKAKKYPG
jgi:uncharacterized protein YfbU (UPF0304 family)